MPRPLQKSLRHFSLFLTSAILLGLAQGCGSETPPPQKKQVIQPEDESDYQKASCEYGMDDGGVIDFNIAASQDFRTLSFGKVLDFAPVHAAERASARATINFFNTYAVRIYQIPESISRCNLFSSLEVAPSDFQSFWDNASGVIKGGGTIVGLYVEKGTPELASSNGNSLIGVREDANRWAVMHEFMHHQFQTYESARTQSNFELQRDFREKVKLLSSASDDYKQNRSRSRFRTLVSAFLEASPLVCQLVRRFPLEEVTIETFLQKEYQLGNLKAVPFLKESSNTYISNSADRAKSLLGALSEIADSIKQDSRASVLTSMDLNLLYQESSTIDSLIREIDSTLNETEAGSMSANLLAQSADLGEAKPVPLPRCAHEHELDQLERNLRRLTAKVRKTLSANRAF